MDDPEKPRQPDSPPPPGWQPWQPPPPPPGPGWSGPPGAWPDAGPTGPAAQQPWGTPPPQWGPAPGQWQAPPQYGTSTLAVIAAVVLLVMGVLMGILGLGVLALAAGGEMLLEEIDPTLIGVGGAIAAVLMVIAVIMLLLAVLHVVSAIGIFMHKGWGRWAGVTTAVIGLVFGVLMLLGQVGAATAAADYVIVLVWLLAYGFATVALAVGGEHFIRRDPRGPY